MIFYTVLFIDIFNEEIFNWDGSFEFFKKESFL